MMSTGLLVGVHILNTVEIRVDCVLALGIWDTVPLREVVSRAKARLRVEMHVHSVLGSRRGVLIIKHIYTRGRLTEILWFRGRV